MQDLRTALREAVRAEALKLADELTDKLVLMFTEQINTALGMPSQFPPAPPPPSGSNESVPPTSVSRERVTEEAKEETLARIVDLLKKYPKGLRSEDIRNRLNVDKTLFQYATNLGKQSDQLVQEGEKRATTYVLPKVPSTAMADGRVKKRLS